ncbi:PIN domain containig nucleic acid binding protein [Janthinobacterium sp. HH01]|uniref:PIN domain-containing protein n=1 Tax=Janthinobacterium sp. HH01 TaxID=1198452 RepID=UPI0002AE82C8|nr:PIN domain-containing protein [Janthinobacterium sp. HH01]ELX12214.1 PIN domain containig nucleic acid binding protein [Janthinobacterium sp. HH01]
MIGPVIIDSNILVDHFNGIAEATRELKFHSDAKISAITWMELMTAFEAKLLPGIMSRADFDTAKSVLSLFPVIAIDDAIMVEAAKIRGASLYAQKKLALPDAIILATANVTGRVLVSRNTKDFNMLSPNVRVPYIAKIISNATPLP